MTGVYNRAFDDSRISRRFTIRCVLPAAFYPVSQCELMKVALFVTCLVDLMRPSIGFATLRLLEAAGCEVVVPEG